MILQNQQFFGLDAFWVFLVTRIDPSRQVSMFPARADLPSTIRAIKHKNNIKKQKYPLTPIGNRRVTGTENI